MQIKIAKYEDEQLIREFAAKHKLPCKSSNPCSKDGRGCSLHTRASRKSEVLYQVPTRRTCKKKPAYSISGLMPGGRQAFMIGR